MAIVEKDLNPGDRKVLKKLRKAVWVADEKYNLIEPGDKVMVCMSGGKDSYTMLDILINMRKARGDFEIIAVNLDQKQPGFPEEVLPTYLSELGVEYKIVQKDTYSIVKEKTPEGKKTCSLCSRLRRGILYAVAKEVGATKIALGHHREDILETLFLNMFFAGKIETMPPKYKTDNGEHIVIRPLMYCHETDIVKWSKVADYPIIPCNLCGSQPNLQRQVIKKMMQDWEKQYPGRLDIMTTSLRKVSPSHLHDDNLWNFDEFDFKETAKAEVAENPDPFK